MCNSGITLALIHLLAMRARKSENEAKRRAGWVRILQDFCLIYAIFISDMTRKHELISSRHVKIWNKSCIDCGSPARLPFFLSSFLFSFRFGCYTALLSRLNHGSHFAGLVWLKTNSKVRNGNVSEWKKKCTQRVSFNSRFDRVRSPSEIEAEKERETRCVCV